MTNHGAGIRANQTQHAVAAPHKRQRSFRPEIQALRAIAVLLVVVYHVWPPVLPGGFIGVDVFFVISGFLITQHIVDEIDRTGRLRVIRFWARRVRRLLPAAFAVLLASLALLLLFVPATRWVQGFTEVAASALYVQNWVLGLASVDYLAAENDPSLVQHFWSLAVEEQFYLVWPALMVALVLGWSAWVRRGASVSRTQVLAGGLSVVIIVSLGYSVWLTAVNPGIAYFSTATRAWEFAAGGLLALVIDRLRSPRLSVWAPLLSWLGLATIGLSAVTYSSHTPFPSYTALLPVVGTLLVIAAGANESAFAPSPLFRLRPVQYLGDVSYSLYLWHWPLIVVYPALRGSEPGALGGFALIGLSVALAALTKRFIEDPFRRDTSVIGLPRRAFVFAAGGAVFFALVAAAGISRIETQALDDQRAAQSVESCIGVVLDRDVESDCGQTVRDLPILPSLAARESDTDEQYDCYVGRDGSLESCTYGVPDSDVRIALTGDSHAASLIPGLARAAAEQGWALDVYVGFGCQLQAGGPCAVREEFDDLLLAGKYDAVLATGWRRFHQDTDSLVTHWEPFLRAGVPLVAVGDVPHLPEDVDECINQSRGSADRLADCVVPRQDALLDEPDQYVDAASVLGIPSIPLDPLLCDDSFCNTVLGGVLVYRDSPASHITATFSRTMSEFWIEEIEQLLS